MAFTAGSKLGPYEISGPLGAGGMGEVYRARDTRLDRTVAIKILPSHLADSAEFRQRFDREARTISSLNHAHICQLFDVGSQDGTDYLVMEFLDGETLADRLRRGALALPELLKTAMEIAEALDVAHRAGIVHRDLKPGNVMLTKSGAKLMDFGLAKLGVSSAAASGAAPLLSATNTISGPSPMSPLTSAGSIVGTIQYMSPEQLEGKDADARSDIFAFGSVLYEMATGKRAFHGKSQISLASAILEKDPEPISTLNPIAPAALGYLVSTCLAKDREERFQTAHDVRLQLRGISQSSSSSSTSATPAAPRMAGPRMLLAAAALLLVAATMSYLTLHGTGTQLSVRAYIPAPTGTAFRASGFGAGPVVVSPDGTMLAFAAVDEKGATNLWLRALNAQQATMLAGTEDAAMPFWSPDGRYLAFIADRKLKKISVSGGEAQTLAEDVDNDGGTWGSNGTLLFRKQRYGPLYRVSDSGGEVSIAKKLDKGETSSSAPAFLPDGEHFLYVSTSGYRGVRKVKVGTLGKPDQEGIAVVDGDSPAYASDHLLFVHGGHLEAQPFSLRNFKLSGDPKVLGEAWTFSASGNGVLAYHESSQESELKLFDRNGIVISVLAPLGVYTDPRFSPDGKSVSVTMRDPHSGHTDLWIYPVNGGQPTRLTFDADNYWIAWSPDGKQLTYTKLEGEHFSIRRRSVDGQQPEEVIFKSDSFLSGAVLDWSSDGKYLSADLLSKDGDFSIWIIPMGGSREAFRPQAMAKLTASNYDGLFSPDSRWLAYFGHESGRSEVYAVPYLGSGTKYQVTTTGGWLPRFSSKGEFFYVTEGNRLMVAPLMAKETFRIGTPRPLFQLDLPNFAAPSIDVSADGQRFVVMTVDHTKSTSITLLTNWPAEVKK